MIPDWIAVEQWATVRLPPNATNAQTTRDREGRVPEVSLPFCSIYNTHQITSSCLKNLLLFGLLRTWFLRVRGWSDDQKDWVQPSGGWCGEILQLSQNEKREPQKSYPLRRTLGSFSPLNCKYLNICWSRNPPFHAYWDKYNHKMQGYQQCDVFIGLKIS